MRYFGGLLFHGGPRADEKVMVLRQRFQEALELQSWLQQPGHFDGSEDVSQEREGLLDATRDLVAALLGRELVLGEPLPYPWDETPLRAALDGSGPLNFSEAIRQHELEIEALVVKQRRSDDLWKRVVAPMPEEDRKLLYDLLRPRSGS
jgi:hypothetical protein